MTWTKLVFVAKGTGVISIQTILNSVIGLFLFMIISRMLSATEMGVFGLASLFISLIVVFGVIGLDFAATRFLSLFKVQGEYNKVRSTAKQITFLMIGSAFSITIISLLTVTFISIAGSLTDQYTLVMQITALVIFPAVISYLLLGILQGLQGFVQMAISRIVAQVARFIFTVFFLIIGWGISGVMVSWVIFYVLIIVVSIPPVMKLLSFTGTNSIKDKPSNGRGLSYRELFVFSLPMMGFYFLHYASSSLDQYVVAALMGVIPLGQYFVASTAAGLIPTILGIPLLATLTSSLSEVYGADGNKGVNRSITFGSRYISFIFIPSVLGLAVLSPMVITALSGSSYQVAAPALSIMCIGLAAYGLISLLTSAFVAIGKTYVILIVLSLSTAIQLIVSIPLIYFLGLNGAAISRTILYFSIILFFILCGKKYLNIKFDVVALIKSSISSIVMVAVLSSVMYFIGQDLLFLPFYIIGGFFIYVACLFGIKSIRQNDLTFIFAVLPGGGIVAKLSRRALDRFPRVKNLFNHMIQE